jgi:hypothetical protein
MATWLAAATPPSVVQAVLERKIDQTGARIDEPKNGTNPE